MIFIVEAFEIQCYFTSRAFNEGNPTANTLGGWQRPKTGLEGFTVKHRDAPPIFFL